MSLSTKIAAILTVLILSLTAIGATVQNRVFGRIFSSIESEEAGLELLRVQSALDAEIDACARSARRVATHERTRAFAADPDSGEVYRAENLSTAALRSDDLDLVYVCTAGGEVLGGTILDGQFMSVQQAMGVPRNDDDEVQPEAVGLLSEFVEEAKRTGLVEELIERHGAKGKLSVAPPCP